MIREAAVLLDPPARLSVSDAAETYVQINVPDSYTGPWRKEKTPYLVEPLDNLASLTHSGMVFVGPAQCGKTDLIVNWAAFSAKVSAADMLVVHISQPAARDFMRRRIDRLIRHSPAINERLGTSDIDDTTRDKTWKSGAILTVSWPSINELSGKPIGRVAITDYDRIPLDIDHEGSAFSLAQKRTQAFGRNAMTLAESSPGQPVLDGEWKRPIGSHEFPPCDGIGNLYNLGHRAWWYWPCIHCNHYYHVSFDRLVARQVDPKDPLGTAESVAMQCPACEKFTEPKYKSDVNNAGVWIAEGQKVDNHGTVTGEPRRSTTLSYWLEGPAAAFQTWQQLYYKHLMAVQQFEATGDEQPLKVTTNTDQGRPYLPRAQKATRSSHLFSNRVEKVPKRTVPPGVRFLVYTIDVQARKFAIAVHGYGVEMETWAIDRFDLNRSGTRKSADGVPQLINPAAYLEDWQVLKKYAIHRRYDLDDGSGRSMGPAIILCDMHGKDGVSDNAYRFYRSLVAEDLHESFFLTRGKGQNPNTNADRFTLTYPDTRSRKDTKTKAATGDIPVFQLNTNRLKDAIAADLEREEPGPGYVHFPDWFPEGVFRELVAEERQAKGWVPRKSGQSNEQWDLMYMAKAGAFIVGADQIDWANPPPWAAEWDTNYFVDGNLAIQDAEMEAPRVLSKGIE